MRVIHPLCEFVALESGGGILLAIAAVPALAPANSPLAFLYDAFLDTPVEVRVGALQVAKPRLLWINDRLMAVFLASISSARCSNNRQLPLDFDSSKKLPKDRNLFPLNHQRRLQTVVAYKTFFGE